MNRWKSIGFALGAGGFQVGERLVISIAIYFYLPPVGRGLEAQVSQEVYAWGLTAFGLAMLIGRAFDTIADPLVAYASDRSGSRFGRRRLFMALGVVPMLAFPVLLFWPPGEPGSPLNFWWLSAILSLYFVFFTFYVAPYLALVPELARDAEQRSRLATVLAAVALPVVGLYSVGWPVAYDLLRELGLEPVGAIRAVVLATAFVALLMCLAPILVINESRDTVTRPSTIAFGPALKATLWNRPFALYLGAQMLFLVGINLVHPAIIYYATVVLGRSEGYAGALGGVLMLSTVVFFLLVRKAAVRYGAKRSIITSVSVFAFALLALSGLQPAEPGTLQDRQNLGLLFTVMAIMGPCLAGFLVIPYMLIGQVIDRDQALTGSHRAAMFFGIQGFATKMMYGLSTAILAFLFARYGNSAGQADGILLVAPVAGVFCLLSALLFLFYPERRVLEQAARETVSEAGPG